MSFQLIPLDENAVPTPGDINENFQLTLPSTGSSRSVIHSKQFQNGDHRTGSWFGEK